MWAEACLAYGRLIERQGGTEMSHAFAREIQIAALEASGGDASEVRARHEQEWRTRLEELSFEAEEMLLGNPELFGTYLAAFREQGESAANEVMRAEAQRLRAEQCGARSADE